MSDQNIGTSETSNMSSSDDNIGLRESIERLVDGFDEIANSGILEEDMNEDHSTVIDDLRSYHNLLREISDNEDFDWNYPTKEAVATAHALARDVITALSKLPYVQDEPLLNEALKYAEEIVNMSSKVVDVSWTVAEYGLALKAANTNPAGAVGAAFAGPEIAKYGIDFIRYVAPSLDTDEETKKIEQNVFGMVGGGATGGATIGGVIGLIGGPPGAAIGAALGGLAGSVAGAIGVGIGLGE